MKVKPLDQISAKWAQRAQSAGQAYSDGIKNPKKDWAQNTAAAASTWATGVQNAANNGRFAQGVTTAGDAAWQNGALNKGASRYGPGVSAAQGTYSSKFSKYQQVLQNLTLPQRMPKGDPANWNRSQAVGQALRAAKVGK